MSSSTEGRASLKGRSTGFQVSYSSLEQPGRLTRRSSAPEPIEASSPNTAEMETAVRNLVCRMADRVGLKGKDLAEVLGVSPSYVSKMRRETATPVMHSHPYENAVLLMRALDALWSLIGNDDSVRCYLYSTHQTLGVIPVEMMKRPEGLVDLTRYVESNVH